MVVVSVGVPVYNGEKYLAQALDSLLAQSFRDFEILISDNASTDRTAEICEAYQKKDRRVQYFRSETNLGAAWNHNRVFELSSSPLVKWAACDDLHHPLFLERCVDILNKDPSVVLSYTRVKMIGERGEVLSPHHERIGFIDSHNRFVPPPDRNHIAESAQPEMRFNDVLSHAWWCFQCFGVMRREAFFRTSGHGNYWGSDKVFIAELALQGRFQQVPEPLFFQRVHDGCSFGKKDIHELEEHMNTSGPGRVYHFLMLKDYLRLVATAEMGLQQRMHCFLSVLRRTLRPGPWRQLLHRFSSTPTAPNTLAGP